MFFAKKNRRRFQSGASSRLSAQVTRATGESLEARQLLTAVTVAPEQAVSVESGAAAPETDVESPDVTDDVFVDFSHTAQLTNDTEVSQNIQTTKKVAAKKDTLVVSNIGSSGDDGVSLEHVSGHGAQAFSQAALPLPPSIPDGLGGDMTPEGTQAVQTAGELYDSITDLREQKKKCDELVQQLQAEADAAKTVLDQAKTDQQTRQDAFDQAGRDLDNAKSDLNDLNSKLKGLKSSLKDAARARNAYARAISAAGRLSRQASRRGDHAAAAGYAAQIPVNFKKYQEKVNEIRALKQQIKDVKQQIKTARQNIKNARAAKNAARKDLNKAKKATAAAQKNYDKAQKRLDDAKEKCRKLCQTLEAQEKNYLGTDGSNGAHGAAVDAIEEGKQNQVDRLAREEAERQQKADEAEAARLRQTNVIQPLDLKAMHGKGVSEHTPCDIAVLIGQQGNGTVPDNPTGQQLAQAAAIKAFRAKGTTEGLKAIGNVLLGAAWDQLKNLVPVLAALDKLYGAAEGVKDFLNDFKNGNIKHQRFHWFPQWGAVQTDIWFNCRTGQYISRTTVLFYDPSTYTQHAGGAGRDGITVPPHLGGKHFTVTHFGTVK
ncbi:MAG: hypothetical protein RIK87_07435 [Fuerstiella sp.]